MSDQTTIDEATVRMLAGLAGLPLADGRAALLAPQLDVWISGANELSRKMSEPAHRTVTPVVVFTHPSK